MKQCKKDVEVTLEDGTVIEAVLRVSEFIDEDFNGDKQSLVGAWDATHEEELDDDQQAEFDSKIEEIVFDEKWDFDNAPEVDEDDDEVLSPEDQEY